MKTTFPHFADALAVFILLALAVFSVIGFEQDWDTICYHLPYAALRTGVMTRATLDLSSGLESRYDGFPVFIDWVQGWLWRLSGTPKAAALITPVAVAALSVYAAFALRLRLIWPVMIFLAVPILQTALQAAYVDLWTNAFFSLYLMAAFRSLRTGGRESLRATIVALLALAVAVNSKQQFYVVGGVAFGLYGCLLLVRLSMGERPTGRVRGLMKLVPSPSHPLRDGAPLLPGGEGSAPGATDIGWQIGLLLILAPLVFAAPLKNFLVWGNPIYPIDLPRLGWQGPERVQFPAATTLAGAPRMARYLLSQFDFNGLSGRAHGYTIDQGESELSPGYHMGGSSGILLFASLAMLVFCLRRSRLCAMEWASVVGFAVLVLFVANFPGANELRYFSFVNITLLLAVMGMLHRLATTDAYAAGLQAGFRVTLVGSVLFTGFVTGFVYLIPHPRTMERVIEKRPQVRQELAAALARSDVVCYSRFDPYGLYYADIFNQPLTNKPYKLILNLDARPCPPGAAEIR